MKKLLSLAMALSIVGSLFVGCGGNETSEPDSTPASTPASVVESETPEAPALEGTLKFSVWDLETTGYFEALKAGFENTYPGTEIEFINTPSAEYTDKLSTMLNGGSDFDVFLIKDADTSLSLYNKGQLEDLGAYIADSGVDVAAFNGLASNFEFEGTQAALPFRTDYYILYYNKDIFDAAEVDYPSNNMTWAEFEEIAELITEGSGADKRYGAFLHTWQACVENWAVQDGKNTIMGPDYTFMTDAYEMALRLQDGGFMPDYGTLTSAQIHYSSAFQTGTAGMMPMGTWFISTMIKAVNEGETDVNWGIATLPHPASASAGYTVGSTTPIAINAASSNKDLAWAFVEFATGEEGARILAEAGQFPARTNDDMLSIITSVDGMPEGAADALQVSNITLDRPIVEHVNEVNTMLGEVHQLIMLGEESLEDALASMAEQSAEIQG